MFKPRPLLTEAPSRTPGDSYVWTSQSDGSWADAANWRDTSTGTTGVSAPGRGDAVTIAGPVPGPAVVTVTGGGKAATLTMTGDVLLEGSYTFGALLVRGFLEVSQSVGTASVSTRRLLMLRGGDINLLGGDLTVSGSSHLSGNVDLLYGSSLQTGNVTLGGVETLSVDATSTIEIGHTGGAAAGALTIDEGFVLSGNGELDSDVIDNGTFVTAGLLFGGDFAGSGLVQINAHSELVADTISSGLTIDFAGTGSVLSVGYGMISAGTPIVGFAAGDAIEFYADFTAETVEAIAGGESLTLTDPSGQVVDTLTLRGATDATTYLLVHVDGSTLLVGTTAMAPGPPAAGTSVRDRYVWTGALGTDWGTAGNWVDLTQGGTATVPPGARDEVVIRAGTGDLTMVTGVGHADTLTIVSRDDWFPVLIDGQVTCTTVTGHGTLLETGAGSLIQADRVARSPYLSLIVDAGSFQAGSVAASQWSLLDGAYVQVGSANSVLVSLDASSRFEVGDTGDVAAGVLTIDAGARMGGGVSINGTVVDNGTLRVDSRLARIIGLLEGSGKVVMDSGSGLYVDGGLAGVTVDMEGGHATLDLGEAFPTGSFSLAGFREGDTLLVEVINAAHVTYRPDGADGGTLTITDKVYGETFATIALVGDYTGDQFLLTPSGAVHDDLIMLPPSVRQANPSAGTTTGDSFVWQGGTTEGTWGNAANWHDTTNSTGSVAPGQLDRVKIDGGGVVPLVVVGSGDALKLTAVNQVVFDGLFDVQTFTGALRVAGQGSVFTAGAMKYTYAYAATDVDGARLMAGHANIGSVSVEDGGSASFGSLTYIGQYYDGTLSVDGASSLTVGPAGTAANAGTITVASGATLSSYNEIQAPLLDDGIVQTEGMTLSGPVSGSGKLVSSEMYVYGPVGSGISIELAGANAELFILDPSDLHATIAGFSDGDYMKLTGLLDAASLSYTYAGNDFGQLTLRDSSGGALDTLALAGDYRNSAFTLIHDTDYGQSITVAGHTT